MPQSHIGLEAIEHLIEIARFHDIETNFKRLEYDYSIGDESLDDVRFRRIAMDLGLDVVVKSLSWRRLRNLGQAFPAIIALKDGSTMLLSGFETDPETGMEFAISVRKDFSTNQYIHEEVAKEDLERGWNGSIYLFRVRGEGSTDKEPFNLTWFFREAMKQKTLFAEIVLIALVIHALALAVPLFFQITVDKVLVHESFSTLNVLAIAVVVVLLFQGVFNFLRDYLLAFATSKIDMRTATRTFGHLVRLPLSYFQRTTAGVLTKHMQQTDEIREFLTGNVLDTTLDATALLVFIPLLFLYSPKLACVVLGFSLLMALVIACMIKPFYNALTQLYEKEADRQSHLVESIHGISTIKSLGLEPRRNRIWDKQSARTVRSSFKVNKYGAIAEEIVETLEQLMTVAILFWGAHMVFASELTIGELIAFKMLSGNVSQPLIKIVQMIHEYQKANLAVKMLGSIMNSPSESAQSSRIARPTITGDLSFDKVSFYYEGSDKPAIKDVSFQFSHGEMIGIVGESGSGKSTLARLIQGLYQSNSGTISVSETDMKEIDLAHLRQSVGIVLQENFLFRGTVKENIALTATNSPLDDIKEAAKMAGADKFIRALPQGYDTILEENGSNLSGGQRQRIAIARALLRNPDLLIFDEATSALDVESETVIQENLKTIAKGRTILVIAHRLSTLHDANRILVMNSGEVEAFGPKEILLDPQSNNFSPTYKRMWEIQMRNALGVVHE